MNAEKTKLIIHCQTQTAALFINEQLLRTYPISTATKGLGCENGSEKTPTGLFNVSEKIGLHAASGTVFQSRVPTGSVWSANPANPLYNCPDDLILTRILWLEGSETHNANTKERYIYIHGTNHEDKLGSPTSHGCIRMGNADIIELFDLIPEGSCVEIRA